MSIDQIGDHFRKASERLDETWKNMRENFVKVTKQITRRREQNPEVLGNQTDAAIHADLKKKIEDSPPPNESLSNAVIQKELHGQWHKV